MTLTICECPTCGRVSDGEGRRGVCAGAAYDNSIHEPVNMARVCVFREEDVRPLWDAARKAALDAHPPSREALAAFPAPEEWIA